MATSTVHEDILNVLRNSDELLSEFRKKIENRYVIIFIGNTRNGKSTLVNYIMGVPMVSFQEGDIFRIEQRNHIIGLEGATIGHGSLSHTTIPAVLPLPDRPDTVIVDAPGFDDNRGVLQEIINALYINQIKYSKGVRFVLVSDINNIINDNINNFLSFIETVHTIMPDAIKLKRAVSIIFAKDSSDHSITEIIDLLKTKILKVDNLYCEKELIRHFVDQKDLIGLFRMPTKAGPLTEEINVNIDGAIFKSLPINSSETDIKFGLSKSARVALLETYLEFFDVVMSMKQRFNRFRMQALGTFSGLEKENLLYLSNEQLSGKGSAEETIKLYYGEIRDIEEQIYEASDIPDLLRKIFVDILNRIRSILVTIGVKVPSELNLVNSNTIEEIQKGLEYLSCIEAVVEKNDKSRDILRSYVDNSRLFQDDLRDLCRGINKEVQTRNILTSEIRGLSDINYCLLEINESYLFASRKCELISIKDSLEYSMKLCAKIFGEISERPHLSQKLRKEMHETRVIPSTITNKLNDVNRHIYQREHEIFLESTPKSVKGVLGAFLIYAGVRFMFFDTYTQFKVATGSMALFALFSWKNKYMRTWFARLERRCQQRRGLFKSRLKLDNYCKNLTRRRLSTY